MKKWGSVKNERYSLPVQVGGQNKKPFYDAVLHLIAWRPVSHCNDSTQNGKCNLVQSVTGDNWYSDVRRLKMIQVKRAYEEPSKDDGERFLVERLWPRGVKKENLQVQEWLKNVAPSKELREWFQHDPAKWAEFRKRYFRELKKDPDAWQPLITQSRRGRVTLIYSAHDTEHNNAVALKEFLDKKIKGNCKRADVNEKKTEQMKRENYNGCRAISALAILM